MAYGLLQENLLASQMYSKNSVPILQRFFCVLLFSSLSCLKCLKYQRPVVFSTNSQSSA